MKRSLVIITMCLTLCSGKAQNTGIGTLMPQERLHVVGSVQFDNKLRVFKDGVIKDRLTVGQHPVADGTTFRVVGGNTRTQVLSAGGVPFADKMLSVYGDAQVSGNSQINTLNVTSDALVNGNFRVDGRIGVNGTTNGSYGLYVNSSNSYFQGDAISSGNVRVGGRIGIGGATNASYGLMVNNADTYLGGNLLATGDAVINSNARLNGRIGINGPTNANYGMIVNNAATYLQGNTTITGDLNVLGTSTIEGNGSVTSNGASSIRVSMQKYHVNYVFSEGENWGYNTFSIPEFGPNVNDIRVSIYDYVDAYDGDPLYSNPREINWWVSAVNPDNNTARIYFRRLSIANQALRGDFYLLIMIRE